MAAPTFFQAGTKRVTPLSGTEHVSLDTGDAVSAFATTADIAALTPTPITVAAAGATQGTATQIPGTALQTVVNVTATLSSEGVKLPTAQTGKLVTLYAPTTKGVKTYAGAAGTVINSNTTATTAFAMTSGQVSGFRAVDATHWRVTPAGAPGSFSTLSATGLASLTGGLTVGGAMKEALTIVSTAGATQGTATAIPATAVLVRASSAASSAGVKLPTVSTGRMVTLLGIVGHSFKVYTAAAGQVINAATTATTAFVMATVRPATFIGVDATHWQALKSA